MFLACPHCGYLVALIVGQDGPARSCPRCGRALPSASEPAAADVAAAADHDVSQAQAPAASASAAVDASLDEGRDPVGGGHDDLKRADLKQADLKQADLKQADPERTERSRAEREPADPDASDREHADDEPADRQQADRERGDDEPASGDATGGGAAPAPAAADAPLPPLTQAAPEPAPRRAPARRLGKSETAVAHVRAQPSFVRSRARAQAAAAPSRRPWLAPLAVALLALALALQLLLAQRAELAADARWRPLVAGLCSALSCAIPPWREPAALTMLNRNVLPVEGRAGVLRVTASFRNDARWPQPWPTLVLSLDDVDGRRVGQRAFSPQDYRKGQAAAGLIAPGQSAAVQFDVLEPAPHVVAFTFDFR